MQGVGTAQDIDTGMMLGTNQPMGPLQLADFIGMEQPEALSHITAHHSAAICPQVLMSVPGVLRQKLIAFKLVLQTCV